MRPEMKLLAEAADASSYQGQKAGNTCLEVVDLQDSAGLLRARLCHALFHECCLIQQVTPEIFL
jgi:hypothetical protein